MSACSESWEFRTSQRRIRRRFGLDRADFRSSLRRQALLWALASLLVFTQLGCGGLGLKKILSRDLQVDVTLRSDLNDDSPLEVELIFVKQKQLVEVLEGMTANQWFAGKEQFERDFPKGYETQLWEWVPRPHTFSLDDITVPRGTITAFLFANYLAPGDHRQRLDPRQPFTLFLERRAFTVTLNE